MFERGVAKLRPFRLGPFLVMLGIGVPGVFGNEEMLLVVLPEFQVERGLVAKFVTIAENEALAGA